MAIVIIKHEIPPKPKDGSIVKCKCKKKYTTFLLQAAVLVSQLFSLME